MYWELQKIIKISFTYFYTLQIRLIKSKEIDYDFAYKKIPTESNSLCPFLPENKEKRVRESIANQRDVKHSLDE